MANTKSSQKAVRQQQTRHTVNERIRKNLRETMATFRAEPNIEQLKEVHSSIDKAVKRGVFKKNKGSRLKAKTSAKIAKTS